MSYQLVIAEKPSVARSIAGVIGADKKQDGYMEGNGYLVSWCIENSNSREQFFEWNLTGFKRSNHFGVCAVCSIASSQISRKGIPHYGDVWNKSENSPQKA